MWKEQISSKLVPDNSVLHLDIGIRCSMSISNKLQSGNWLVLIFNLDDLRVFYSSRLKSSLSGTEETFHKYSDNISFQVGLENEVWFVPYAEITVVEAIVVMSLCQFSDLLFKIAPSQDVFTLLIIYKTNNIPFKWVDRYTSMDSSRLYTWIFSVRYLF